MSQGDVAKRRESIVKEARVQVEAALRRDLKTLLPAGVHERNAIYVLSKTLPEVCDELAAAERERIALQDKVDRVREYVEARRERLPFDFGDRALRQMLDGAAAVLDEVSAALSDEPELDAAAAVVIEAQRYNAEHGTE